MVALALSLVWGLGSAVAASESPTPTLYGGSASPAASASAAAPSPAAGTVVYKVGWLAEPDNLNPFIGYLWSSFEIWDLAYEPLVGYDYGTLTPTKGAQATGLATDWDVTPDGKTWTFTIRLDLTWSDGLPVTARDVAFTYNYIIKNELQLHLVHPVHHQSRGRERHDGALRLLAAEGQHAEPLDPHPARAHLVQGPSTKKPPTAHVPPLPFVGSGPLPGRGVQENSYVEMVAQQDYWRGAPKIDEILFETYQNADTMTQDLKSALGGLLGDAPQAQFKPTSTRPGIALDAYTPIGFDQSASTGTRSRRSSAIPCCATEIPNAQLGRRQGKMICAIAYGGFAPGTTVIPPNYYKDPDWHWEPPAEQRVRLRPGARQVRADAAGYQRPNGTACATRAGAIPLRLWARLSQTPARARASWLAGSATWA